MAKRKRLDDSGQGKECCRDPPVITMCWHDAPGDDPFRPYKPVVDKPSKAIQATEQQFWYMILPMHKVYRLGT